MRRNQGFTLAELLVAASLLSIVMAAVYVAFGNTIRIWRAGETETNYYQDARLTLDMLSRELECVVNGDLLEGKHDDIQFFSITPSLDVKKGTSARVMWVRYYSSGRKLYRQEAPVEGPLPSAMGVDADKDIQNIRKRIKLGHKKKFELADNVKDFEISYRWTPEDPNLPKDQPPPYVEPIVLKRSEKGWGLPHGIRCVLTLRKDDEKKVSSDFVMDKTFRITPRTVYDPKRIGKAKETKQ